MKTVNQINGNLQSNATILMYKQVSADWHNWRNRSFNFDYGNGRKQSNTITGNFLFWQAQCEFNNVCFNKFEYKYDFNREHKSAYFEIEYSGAILQFNVRAELTLSGTQMYFETNFSALKQNNFKKYQIRSNQTFADINIEVYFRKTILKKELFAEGLFQNIQVIRNCNKAEAIRFYNEYVKPKKANEAPDTLKAIRTLMKRKRNVVVADGMLSEKTILNAYNTIDFQKKRKKLYREPSIFEISEAYATEHDTEDSIEPFLNEYMESNYSKNAIFI